MNAHFPRFHSPSHCSSLDSLVLFLSPFQAHLKFFHQAPVAPGLELFFTSEMGTFCHVSLDHMLSKLSHGQQMQNFSTDTDLGAMQGRCQWICLFLSNLT